MFQSDQMKPNPDGSVNSWSEGLFWLTMTIILVSTIYFFVIFISDISTAFGYTTSCQKKKLQKALLIEMEKGDSVDMDQNPLHISKEERQEGEDSAAVAQSRQDLIEAQETIQRMQSELKTIKQERKTMELGSMGSFKGLGGGSKQALQRGESRKAKKKAFGNRNVSGSGHILGHPGVADEFRDSSSESFSMEHPHLQAPPGAIAVTSARPRGGTEEFGGGKKATADKRVSLAMGQSDTV